MAGEAGFPVVLPSGQNVFLLHETVHPYQATTFLPREAHDTYARSILPSTCSSSTFSTCSSRSMLSDCHSNDNASEISSLSSGTSMDYSTSAGTGLDFPDSPPCVRSAQNIWQVEDRHMASSFGCRGVSLRLPFSSEASLLSVSSTSSFTGAFDYLANISVSSSSSDDDDKEFDACSVEHLGELEEVATSEASLDTPKTIFSTGVSKTAAKKLAKVLKREKEEQILRALRRTKQEARTRRNAAKKARRAERQLRNLSCGAGEDKLDDIDAALLELDGALPCALTAL